MSLSSLNQLLRQLSRQRLLAPIRFSLNCQIKAARWAARSIHLNQIIQLMREQDLEKWEVKDLMAYKSNLHHRINQLRSMILVCERQNIDLQGELNQLKQEAARLQAEHNTFYHRVVENSKKLAEGIKNIPKPHLPSKQTISENMTNLKNNLVEKGVRVKDSLMQTGQTLRKRIWGESQSSGLREKDFELELPGAKELETNQRKQHPQPMRD